MSLSVENPGFNNDIYLDLQMDAFRDRLDMSVPNIVEFGGKPFGDYHAARVLPGYDPDAKAYIIGNLLDEMGPTRTAVVVNAQDIIGQPDGRRTAQRIRGDSSLTYDNEVLRMTDEAREVHSLPITDVVVAATPRQLSLPNQVFIERYIKRLGNYFDNVHVKHAIDGYPDIPPFELPDRLLDDDPICNTDESLLIMSPGGGSGKFGVAVTEIAHMLDANIVPNFIKFETFPVFRLPQKHPLNMAFLAATADLPNTLTTVLDKNEELTNYDKDVENLFLLRSLLVCYPEIDTTRLEFSLPTDMGVNVIDAAITDDQVIARACSNEIIRRIARYKREVLEGNESQATTDRTITLLGELGLKPA